MRRRRLILRRRRRHFLRRRGWCSQAIDECPSGGKFPAKSSCQRLEYSQLFSMNNIFTDKAVSIQKYSVPSAVSRAHSAGCGRQLSFKHKEIWRLESGRIWKCNVLLYDVLRRKNSSWRRNTLEKRRIVNGRIIIGRDRGRGRDRVRRVISDNVRCRTQLKPLSFNCSSRHKTEATLFLKAMAISWDEIFLMSVTFQIQIVVSQIVLQTKQFQSKNILCLLE